MILSFPPHNLTKVLILIQNWSSFFTKASLIVLFILVQSFALIPTETIQSNSQTMKVHPIPKKRNITIQYDMNSRNPLSEAQALLGLTHKKLRRLPHVFSRVLELPFRSDADVLVEETPDCFRFVAETDGIGDVRAHTVEIHPGVTKIVVRESGSVELSLDELELDMWRFRLPESTRPELASAVFVDGELIVTVPKGEELENSEDGSEASDEEMWGDGNGNFGGGMGGRLVLVQ
ncbi:Heat shock 22 kDa protein [Quillaja saponaria]|uniref:Heat shock 22 kDa protein n=1 Tax=Quillaja saponaria TaxID=32244 RepID=A0AAD7QFR0_QUISA|nr:Heat shock 22 kDa protein [Quillaja saponaria]